MFYDITNLPRYLPSSHVVHTPREHNNLRHNPRIVIDCENAARMIMTQNPANFPQTFAIAGVYRRVVLPCFSRSLRPNSSLGADKFSANDYSEGH